MITYDKLYKKIGVRKLGHFINPIIITDDEFTFPKSSELYWFKISDNLDIPKSNASYLTNSKNPVVITKFKYSNPIGSIREKHNGINKDISSLRKKDSGFKFLNHKTKKIKINKELLLINNYGIINNVNIDNDKVSKDYNVWKNTFNTIIEDIMSTGIDNNRVKFINIDLPDNMPDKSKLDLAVKMDKKRIMNDFPTYKHLTILEIWKFLTLETTKESILFKITNKALDRVNLLFTYNNKVVVLNLGTLVSAVKEFEKSDKIQEQPIAVMRKMFLILLMKIKNDGSIGMDVIDRDDKKNVNISYMDDNDDTEIEKVNPDAILEEEIDEDIDNINYGKITEDNLGLNESENMIEDMGNNFNSISDIKKEVVDVKLNIKEQTDVLRDNKLISKRDVEIIEESLKYQENAKDPYGGDSKLKDMLNVTADDLKIPEEYGKIPPINILKDDGMLEDPIKAMSKHYINNLYRRDLLSIIYSMQKNNIIIVNHSVDIESSILGGVETHTINVKPLTGKPSKLVFKLPVIDKDGVFTISSNKYLSRAQKADIPIRKISNNKVALGTYYGKSFITRSDFKKDDVGYWFKNKLVEMMHGNNKISNVVLIPIKLVGFKLPKLYTTIARYTKMFKINDIKYSFDYRKRAELKTNDKITIEAIEDKGKYVLVGKVDKTNDHVVMDMNSNLFLKVGSKLTELPSIFEQLNIDVKGMPIENVTIKVFKNKLPVGLLLSYYLGFEKLLKVLKCKFNIIDSKERYSVDDNEYILQFKDKKVILNKDDEISTLILGGFKSLHKNLKDVELKLLNKKETFVVLFNSMALSPLYINEIKLMEKMFVDPISKTVLESINEPTTFKGLLIRATEILIDDNYVDPNDSSGMLIKGYERISGLVYKNLINSMRDFENKNVYSKAKMVLDPYNVWRDIGNDSTTMLVDDLNPIANLKQYEDLTSIGEFGLNKASVGMDKRVFHPSEVGVISEGVKDSGDVGISAYMSANPKIENVRGKVKDNKGKLNPSNYLSTSALLAPAATMDDGKRLMFSLSS